MAKRPSNQSEGLNPVGGARAGVWLCRWCDPPRGFKSLRGLMHHARMHSPSGRRPS